MKDGNYYQISGWMGNRLGLRGNELICFAVIYGFSQDEETWFNGNLDYLSGCMFCSRPTTLLCLEKLLKLDLIRKHEAVVNGKKRCYYKATVSFEDGHIEYIPKDEDTSKEPLPMTSKEPLPNNNSNNNKGNNIKEKRLSNDNQKKDEFSQDFLEFWELYDNKKNKVGTYKKWKNLSAADKKAAIEAIPAYFADCKAHNNREKKHPLTYINQRTWEDDFTSEDEKEEKEEMQADEIPADDIEVWNNNQKWMQSKTPRLAGRVTFKMFSKMRALSTWNNKLYAEVLIEIDQSGYDGDIVAEFERRLDKRSKV